MLRWCSWKSTWTASSKNAKRSRPCSCSDCILDHALGAILPSLIDLKAFWAGHMPRFYLFVDICYDMYVLIDCLFTMIYNYTQSIYIYMRACVCVTRTALPIRKSTCTVQQGLKIQRPQESHVCPERALPSVCFSPQLCVGFLFLILYPGLLLLLLPPPYTYHNNFTHALLTYNNFTHTNFTHTQT